MLHDRIDMARRDGWRASARSPSRITSLSQAYSPDVTLARTMSAMSWGTMTLICRVVLILHLLEWDSILLVSGEMNGLTDLSAELRPG